VDKKPQPVKKPAPKKDAKAQPQKDGLAKYAKGVKFC
jgi:hypothetical protein